MPKHGENQLITEQSYKVGQIARSGSLAMAVAGVLALSSFQTLDNSLIVSLFALSIAIPFLSASVFIGLYKQRFKYYLHTWYTTFLSLGGLVATLIGITAIFFHFSSESGWLFIVAFTVSLLITGQYVWKLKSINEDKGT